VRIKALPLSQSKQEKRTKGVTTIQRGKNSWNQRPQKSGSSTPPLTRAPRARAAPPCAPPPPHFPFAAHPPPPSPPATPSPLPIVVFAATWHLLHHRHSAPEHHLAYRSPIKPPTSSLNSYSTQSKTLPIKIPSAKSQATPFSTPSPLRSQCLVILGLKTVAHGS
jgi:hypothetical protein